MPYSDFDTVYYGLGYEQTELNGDLLGMPLNYQIYIEQFGRDSNAFPLTLAWSRDQRDSTVTPAAVFTPCRRTYASSLRYSHTARK